jgi:thiol reductant ABC exporter CydD subunit
MTMKTKSPTKPHPSIDRRLLAGADRRALRAVLALTAAASLVVVVQAWLFSGVINRIFLRGETLADAAGTLVILALVVAVRALLVFARSAAAGRLAIRAKADLRQRFMSRLVELGPAYTQGERSGELALTATEGIEKLDAYYRAYLPAAISAVLIPILILLIVVPLDALTFLVLLVTAPLIPLFMALIGMAAGALARRQFAEMQFLGAHFLDVMQGLTTLKLFNRSAAQADTIARISGRLREATMRVLRVAFLSAFSLEMLATLSVAIVAVEIGVRLIHGGIGFHEALFLLVIAPEFYQPLRTLGTEFHAGTEGKAAAARVFAVLDAQGTLHTPPASEIATPSFSPLPACVGEGKDEPSFGSSGVRGGSPPAQPDSPITFAAVHFAYADRLALNGLTFTLKPGQRMALVGASGSGKSTAANLLLRFITPQSGRITVGGADLQSIPPDVWRSQIGWVAQKPYLFNTTIADNIRLGSPDASLEAVVEAAHAASAHDFISALPQGYDTRCGERGLKLSGGQAQRIAIARAFLRGAPLLILDEATANLDPETEAEIEAALSRLMAGRTVLMIAHRLATVVQADRIVVLDEGRVVEQGSPVELLAAGGAYARLVKGGVHV